MAGAKAVWASLLCDARLAQCSAVTDLWHLLTWRARVARPSPAALGAAVSLPPLPHLHRQTRRWRLCAHLFPCPRAWLQGCGIAAMQPHMAQCNTATGICQPVGDQRGSGAAGRWADNKPDGDGCYKYPNGDIFQGTFQQGLKHGGGSYYFKVRHTLTAQSKPWQGPKHRGGSQSVNVCCKASFDCSFCQATACWQLCSKPKAGGPAVSQ